MIQKLLLISIIIASIAIPVWSARDANPRRGLTKAVRAFLAFNFVYVLAIKFLYWHVL